MYRSNHLREIRRGYITLAGLGLGLITGFWIFSHQLHISLDQPLALTVLFIFVLALLVVAFVERNAHLAKLSQQSWFIDHAEGDDACILLGEDLIIRAANERAYAWLTQPNVVGKSLSTLFPEHPGWSELFDQLQQRSQHAVTADTSQTAPPIFSSTAVVGDRRLGTLGAQVDWTINGIQVPMSVSWEKPGQQEFPIMLKFSPALSQTPRNQPSPSEFYGLLMDSSLSAKIVIDEGGIVVDYNPAAESLLGFKRAETIGARMSELIIPERLRQAHITGFERFLTKGHGPVIDRRVELEALHKDGYEFPIELTVNALTTGHGVYFAAEFRDLRKWRALENEMRTAKDEAEQANQSKSRFLATMSHEIRTPLNALLGILNLVKVDEEQAHRRSLLATAETAGQRLMSLLTNMLDYSRIEAGEMIQEKRAFAPAVVVREVAELYRSSLSSTGIALHCEVNDLEGLWVLGDTQKVAQVVTNLVSNAVKFTERGHIDIVLELDKSDESNHQYRIKVRDSGIGMTKEELGKVFDAFVQVDDSDRRKYLGTGLGLSISKELAELMGGDLSVTSTPKKGSVFVMTLPLIQATPPALSPNRNFKPTQLSCGQRILVVEDSKPNQLVVRSILERCGYTVDVANDGIEACTALRKKGQGSNAYGLILMDVQMPGMDGIEATRWIRNHGFTQPIIALTAKAFFEDEKACLAAGMDDFMTKPVSFEGLSSRVDMWIGRSELSKAVLPSEKLGEMREMMGDRALHEALAVFSEEVQARHQVMHDALAQEEMRTAAAALHTLAGTYLSYGFNEPGHLCHAMKEACDANLMPQSSALEQCENLSTQLLTQIKVYQSELRVS